MSRSRNYSPATTNEKGEQAAESKGKIVDLTGSETILLVDDDDAVRNIVTRILAKLKYTVCAAQSAEMAEDIFGKYGNIDLLLTDIVMPKSNGVKLYESLAQRRPSLKVIFMSGYTDMLMKEKGHQLHHAPFLQKPFTLDDIATLIRSVLDGK